MERAELERIACAAGLAAAASRAPAGVTIRPWREEADFVAMAEVRNAAALVDAEDYVTSPARLHADYELWAGDPAVTTFLAEVDGRLVGWVRGFGPMLAPDTGLIDEHGGGVTPAWRRRGIGSALLAGIQAMLLARPGDPAGDPPPGTPTVFQAYAPTGAAGSVAMLEQDGYRAARWGFHMVRRNLAEIPEVVLPPGIELRPVGDPPEALRIARAMEEAMADHPGWQAMDEAMSRAMLEHPLFGQTAVWQVAWEGDQPVSGVLGWIDAPENLARGRFRGYTECIFTRRPWRKRGLASALIAANLRLLRDRGMHEAALTVDTENPSGALGVYQRMGFEVESGLAIYRRPI